MHDGCVTRESVITVLRASAVSLAVDGFTITLVKDGKPEVYVLPEHVPRRLLQRISNKYDIRIEYFFHPAMLGTAGNA